MQKNAIKKKCAQKVSLSTLYVARNKKSRNYTKRNDKWKEKANVYQCLRFITLALQ